MTFYWWSHWFWITLLILQNFSTFVYAYPNQDNLLNYNKQNFKITTKLHQTTTSDERIGAITPASNNDAMLVTELFKAKELSFLERAEIESADEHVVAEHDNIVMQLVAARSEEEGEFKRSAENFNATNERMEKLDEAIDLETEEASGNSKNDTYNESMPMMVETVILKRDDKSVINNFTNFTSSSNANEKSANDKSVSATLATMDNLTLNAIATNKTKLDDSLQHLQIPLSVVSDSQVDMVDNVITTTTSATSTTSTTSTTTSNLVPFKLENANNVDELRRAENEQLTRTKDRTAKNLLGEYTSHTNRYSNHTADQKSILTRSASTAPYELDGDSNGNISSEPLSSDADFLDASAIIAICFTVFGVCCTVGTIGIMLYRRRYLNKPQTLSEPDSSVYIDDSTMRVSDNSDEMYSLDNDSFLNSLEAMTIQNYWTDTVKHTKL